MSGAAWNRRLAPLLLLVALLATTSPAATAPATVDATGHRITLDRAHALTLSDHAATGTSNDDRRPLPLGAVPTVLGAALLALLVALVLRPHRAPTERRRSAFRRRAPPLLRTAI